MTRRKKCERERKKAEREEKSGKCALLVKPSDLCLVINKQHRGILVKESAVFNSQNYLQLQQHPSTLKMMALNDCCEN